MLISSDFEEVERVCHRALVFSRGRVARRARARGPDRRRLTAAAAGGAVTHGEGGAHERAAAMVGRGAALTRAVSVWGLLILLLC